MSSGGRGHRTYSVAVFVVLASLDNVAIGLVPPLYGNISDSLRVSESAIGLVTAVSFLFSAVAWAYTGDRHHRKPLLSPAAQATGLSAGPGSRAGRHG